MSVAPLYDKATPNTDRGLTAALWQRSLEAYVSNDPVYGQRLTTDFINESFVTSDGATNQLTGTTALTYSEGWTGQDAVTAGGTYLISILDQEGGWASIDNGTGTADFGTEMGRATRKFALPSATSVPSSRFVGEVRLSNTDADVFGFVMTDAAESTPICGNNALADVGYIGFRVNEAGDLLFVTSSAAAGTTDSATVILAANWTATGVHKLGFAVNAIGGTNLYSVDIVVDGVWYNAAAKTINPSSLPTGVLAPRIFVCSGNSGTAPTALLDSVDLFAANAVG